MKTYLELINEIVKAAFEACHYASEYGMVSLSNRPDLCQFQCNGALVAAKVYKESPLVIAEKVTEKLKQTSAFKQVECVKPGFINITLADAFLVEYLNKMSKAPKFGCEEIGKNQTIIVDYGGPNVAKPLHVGHIRTAIIGESIKRMGKFLGYHMLGDVHLGDWGLQIGMIIAEVHRRQPDLVYFDETYRGEYPIEAPFTIGELEEIYPTASQFAKETPWFMEAAKEATYEFQNGRRGYVALWKHILNVSVKDLKKNYAKLNVYFDLWKKESDAQPYIPSMINLLKEKGMAQLSEGAWVVDVKEETDKKEMPPCILVKSDGATLYSTTDLATIVERMKLYQPNEIIYIVDKRQAMHFEQVFRCAKKAALVLPETKLTFLGFGTMNGKGGKPFKTREGGVMRLETLIDEVSHKVYEKIMLNKEMDEEEAKVIAHQVGVAALKYGDLSNQVSKDYVFDLERFTSFEGNTGPYILYTVVRINSILSKFEKANRTKKEEKDNEFKIKEPNSKCECDLMLKVVQFNEIIEKSFKEYAPQRICQYIYELANDFNRFYHENKIISEEDQERQNSWIQLLKIVRDILNRCLDLLAIEVPEKM